PVHRSHTLRREQAVLAQGGNCLARREGDHWPRHARVPKAALSTRRVAEGETPAAVARPGDDLPKAIPDELFLSLDKAVDLPNGLAVAAFVARCCFMISPMARAQSTNLNSKTLS